MDKRELSQTQDISAIEELKQILSRLENYSERNIEMIPLNNNKIFIYIDGSMFFYYPLQKRITVSMIDDWGIYELFRDYIDADVREVLDKFSASKPIIEFEDISGMKDKDYEKAIELNGETKKKYLNLLVKLLPIIDKLERFILTVEDDHISILLNNIEMILSKNDELENIIMPLDDLQKLFQIDCHIVMKLYKDFYVFRDYRENSFIVDEIRKALGTEVYTFEFPNDEYIYIIPLQYLKKFLDTNKISPEIKSVVGESFEVTDGELKYVITKHNDDKIHINVMRGNNSIKTLETYLWYFGVKSFDELKFLNPLQIIRIIDKQLNEKYFYPMSYNEVKEKVEILLDNLLSSIDEAIDSIKNRDLTFTKTVKNVISISCIFDNNCSVGIDVDELGNHYYSLLATDHGHLPIPILLEEYLEYDYIDYEDETALSPVKNVIYFVRGYDTYIPEGEREYIPPDQDDGVRETVSIIFEKAVILYNKLLGNDDDDDCPWGTLYDGLGYCRKIEHRELLEKSEDELANDLLDVLEEIKEKIFSYRIKISPNIKEPSNEVNEIAFRIKDQLSTVHRTNIRLIRHRTTIKIKPEECIEMSEYFFERLEMFLKEQLGFSLTNTHEVKDSCFPIYIGAKQFRKDNKQITIYYERDTTYDDIIYCVENLEVNEIRS